MSRKLYVGGLAYSASSENLTDLFAEAGSVTKATVMTDRETGRSRGFGFVEMASDNDAQSAINAHNGKSFQGRTIVVSEAREKTESRFSSGGRSNSRW